MSRTSPTYDEKAWYLFAGCALIGLGIGMAAGSAFAGLVIGAGIGFLAMVGLPYVRR